MSVAMQNIANYLKEGRDDTYAKGKAINVHAGKRVQRYINKYKNINVEKRHNAAGFGEKTAYISRYNVNMAIKPVTNEVRGFMQDS
jgi:hypothetical protein